MRIKLSVIILAGFFALNRDLKHAPLHAQETLAPVAFKEFLSSQPEQNCVPKEIDDLSRSALKAQGKSVNPSTNAMFPLFDWPIAIPLNGLILGNYVDDDPSFEIRDYMGNSHSYNGHNGTDVGPTGFREMDRGIPILAAADGVVIAVEYSRYDRNHEPPFPDNGNYVIIHHDDGTEARYWHLRKNSIAVNVGETVQAGQVLGLMGSSGFSSDAHLHFEVAEYLNGEYTKRDPWHGTYNTLPSLWENQEPYVGNSFIISDIGMFNEEGAGGNVDNIPWYLIKQGLTQPAIFGSDERVIGMWIRLQGLAGDQYVTEIRRPDNSVYGSFNVTLPTKTLGWHLWIWNFTGNVFPSQYGIWRGRVVAGGSVVQEVEFEVGPSTVYKPRFWPIAGKSLRITGSQQRDTLRVSALGGPVTYSLRNAPSFVTLTQDSIVIVAGVSSQPDRVLEFQALATDASGRADTMWYHIVDPTKPDTGEPPPCFTDNFDDGAAEGWTPLTPIRWAVGEDAGSLRYGLYATNYDSPDGVRLGEISLIDNHVWDDFTFECVAKSEDAALGNSFADLCVVFGYQDFDSYYYAMFNNEAGFTVLQRIHDGTELTLATYDQPTLVGGGYHALRLQREGSQVRVFYGGAEILSANDDLFGAGQIGVGSFNDAGYFDNVAVACPVPELFTDIGVTLPGAGSAWGDYDNDGDLDILGASKIYRNDDGNFVEVVISIESGTIAWGDYDSDNDFDVVSVRSAGSKIYRNDAGVFTDIAAPLLGFAGGTAAWGDYDNDGDSDLLITGCIANCSDAPFGWQLYSTIYRNDDGNFVDTDPFLNNIFGGSVAWGDYDNDADLDILISGDNGSFFSTRIYRNIGGSFTSGSHLIIALITGSTAWGDYDNDGDLDVLLAGLEFPGIFTQILQNNNGSFMNIAAPLPGIRGATRWGDFDNDGDLDILLSGSLQNGNTIAKLYRNDSGNFVEFMNLLTDGINGAGRWGDYDKDGDLDLIVRGQFTNGDSYAKIYRNNTTSVNFAPAAPAGLASSINGNTVTLSWESAADDHTPQAGLTYNLRVGTTSGGSEIVSPMADANSGFRRLPELGNTNHNTNWTIKNLAPGMYFWSVQAIDHAFAGSAFAPEQSFSICASTCILGNVTLPDNEATIFDALVIATYAVGLPIPPEFLEKIEQGCGNVTRIQDNDTSIFDSLIIATFAVGLPVAPFPVGEPLCL